MSVVAEGLPDEIHAFVRELMQHIYGSQVHCDSYHIANKHHDYYALIISLKNPALKVILKLAGPQAPYLYPFEQTAHFHRLIAAETTIPVAQIIAVDTSYAMYPWRYLVMEHIEGEEWAHVKPRFTPDEQITLYGQIGNAVGELHHITFAGFGAVNGNENTFFDTDYFPALLKRAELVIRKTHHREVVIQLLESHRDLFVSVTQPSLCHEDLHHHNLLFHRSEHGWQLAALLDFDKAWAGHNEIDLAKMDLWDNMIGEGFWEAYQAIKPIDEGYYRRRPFYQLMWCFEYAVNTPRHIADTQRLCKMLNLPMIENFE